MHNTRWSCEQISQWRTTVKKTVSDYEKINSVFDEQWIDDLFNERFNNGIHPMISLLLINSHALKGIEKVFTFLDLENKVIKETIRVIKQNLPFQSMYTNFNSRMLEFYVYSYLLSKNIKCTFRKGAGADLVVETDQGTIDIEITNRFQDLVHKEFDDFMLRCIINFCVKSSGEFKEKSTMEKAVKEILEHIDISNTETPLKFDNVLITLTPGPGIHRNFIVPHFINKDSLHSQIGYKVNEKSNNSNQTGNGRPVIIVVGMRNITDSSALDISNNYYGMDLRYPHEKIPHNISAVSILHWTNWVDINPSMALGSINSSSPSDIFGEALSEALGLTYGNSQQRTLVL